MLPATFQTPAAIMLLLGGLLACFAGYRVFRVVLAIYGFILGALLASSFMGTEQTLWMVLDLDRRRRGRGADPAGGVFRGRGAARRGHRRGGGAHDLGGVQVRAGRAGADPVLDRGRARRPGAAAVCHHHRYGVRRRADGAGRRGGADGRFRLRHRRRRRAVYRVYPLDPMPNTYWDATAALVLGAVGVLVQLAVTAKGKK